MSSRSEILAQIRKNQPAPRPLPEVPTFDAPTTTPLIELFKAGVIRMGGKIVDSSPLRSMRCSNGCFRTRKSCSAAPEVAGNRSLDRVRANGLARR